jgi:hypothetical protein
MALDIVEISTLCAEQGVNALISTEPIIPIMDKGLSATYTQGKYETGSTIEIRLEDQPLMPTQSNVMRLDPVVQGKISATVLQYNDGISLGGLQQEYDLGGNARLKTRVFKPRMETMAVKASVLCYEEIATCPNYFGTAGTDLTTAAHWGAGAAVLRDQLATSGLYAIMSNSTEVGTAAALAAAFNPTTESATAYMKGRVKEAMGINFFSTSNLPNHTNGSAVGNGSAGMIISTNVTTGATSFAVSGGTANGTITQDSLVWASGIYAVQPHTKKTLSTLRYFNVTSTATLNGSGVGTINVYPAIVGPENPKLQTCSALPTTSSYIGIVGTASHTYEQAVIMKKNASALISLPLPDLEQLHNARDSYDGFEVKVTAGADITNYVNSMRWDILAVAKNLQWRHIARAFTRDLG